MWTWQRVSKPRSGLKPEPRVYVCMRDAYGIGVSSRLYSCLPHRVPGIGFWSIITLTRITFSYLKDGLLISLADLGAIVQNVIVCCNVRISLQWNQEAQTSSILTTMAMPLCKNANAASMSKPLGWTETQVSPLSSSPKISAGPYGNSERAQIPTGTIQSVSLKSTHECDGQGSTNFCPHRRSNPTLLHLIIHYQFVPEKSLHFERLTMEMLFKWGLQ